VTVLQQKEKAVNLKDTLGNEQWLRANEKAVKDMLPETWTHMNNLNGLQLGFKMKLLGIDWRSEDEFGRVMVFLERIGFMSFTAFSLARSHCSLPSVSFKFTAFSFCCRTVTPNYRLQPTALTGLG
jgi:hypothetical protein